MSKAEDQTSGPDGHGTNPATIDTPEIRRSERRIAAVIHMTVPREEMKMVMGPAVEELRSVIAGQACEVVGPMFAHHLTLSSSHFDFEVGFPVDAPVHSAGRVRSGELPAARVAWTTYRGDYQGLFEAWDEFGKWAEQNGVRGKGTLWESYAIGPESDPDPRSWVTELYLPIEED